LLARLLEMFTKVLVFVSALLTVFSSCLAVTENERNALLSIYQSTGGDNWSNNLNWGVDDPCNNSWHGIECSSNHVSEVNLYFNKLVGVLPEVFGDLPNLTAIRVSSNGLYGPLPKSLSMCNNTLIYAELGSNLFSGEIPIEFGYLKTLMIMSLDGNDLSGPVPCSFGGLVKLRVMRLFDNRLSGQFEECHRTIASQSGAPFNTLMFRNEFTGPVPIIWQNVYMLSAYDNRFTSISVHAGNAPFIARLRIDNNLLSGPFPDVFGTYNSSLVRLYADGNDFTGPVPSWVCSMSKLQELSISSNHLTGTVPECIGYMPSLKTIRLSNNQLDGPVPNSLMNSSSLEEVYFGHNNLQGFTAKFESGVPIRTFDLSDNDVSDIFDDYLNRFYSTDIQNIDISGNNMIGGMTYWGFLNRQTALVGVLAFGMNSIVKIAASNNRITGTLPAWLQRYSYLNHLDLSHNDIEGDVPDSYTFLDYLLLANNSRLASTRLPAFLTHSTDELLSEKNESLLCPIFVPTEKRMVIGLDPAYLNYTHCSCAPGHYGVNGTCHICIENGVCPGETESPIAKRGYFPVYIESEMKAIVECFDPLYDFKVCNPQETEAFACETGYEGRMCGRCSYRYYAVSRLCQPCSNNKPAFSVMLMIVFAVLITFLFIARAIPPMLSPKSEYKLLSAVRRLNNTGFRMFMTSIMWLGKSLVFYIQLTVYQVFGIPVSWPEPLFRLAEWLSIFAFSGTGVSCMTKIKEYDVGFYALLTVTLFFTLLAILMTVFERAVKGKFKIAFGMLHFFAISLVNLIYMSLVYNTLKPFACRYSPDMDVSYMVHEPDILCTFGDPQWKSRVIYSIIIIPLCVIGLPILFTFMLFRKQEGDSDSECEDNPNKSSPTSFTLSGLDAVTMPYRNECRWWELAVSGRRLVLGIVLTVGTLSSHIMSFMFFAITMLYLGLVIHFRPYEYVENNMLEMIATVGVLLNYVAGITSNLQMQLGSKKVLGYLVLALNLILIATFIAIAMLEAVRYGKKKEEVDDIEDASVSDTDTEKEIELKERISEKSAETESSKTEDKKDK
jgi:Leucine-rich repeat (LRR) protein